MIPRAAVRRAAAAPVPVAGIAAILIFAFPGVGAARVEADSLPRELPRIVRYDLEFDLDYDKRRLEADCRVSVMNPHETPAVRIPLIMHRLLRVDSIRDAGGRDLDFRQQVVAFEDWDKLQVNFIEVELPAPLPRGGRTTLDVRYAGYLTGYPEAMPYVRDRIDPAFTIIRMDGKAYPEIGVPSWTVNRSAGLPEYDYRIRVSAPDSLVAANGGRLVDKTSRDGRTTWVYENILPVWRIDVAIADYGIIEDRAHGMRVFHFKDDEEGARRILDAMSRCMALYTEWFGPLAARSDFSVIEVPEGYGSQSDVSCILQTRDAFLDPARLVELYHEISHLWNVRPLDPLPSRFESEGLAMFLQYLARERLENAPDALEQGARRMFDLCRKRGAQNPRIFDVPMIDYGKERLTDFSYSVGMLFFNLLYEMAGEEAFLRAVGSVYRTFHDRGLSSRDFLNHFAEETGLDLESFYQAWIFTPEGSRAIRDCASLEDLSVKYIPRRILRRRDRRAERDGPENSMDRGQGTYSDHLRSHNKKKEQ